MPVQCHLSAEPFVDVHDVREHILRVGQAILDDAVDVGDHVIDVLPLSGFDLSATRHPVTDTIWIAQLNIDIAPQREVVHVEQARSSREGHHFLIGESTMLPSSECVEHGHRHGERQ